MTIFTKIIEREIPADIVYEDELALAFRDINPQAPTHILVIPKRPIARITDVEPDDEALLGHLITVCREIAEAEGVAESGFRLVVNNGRDGGQEVEHIHVHLLAGRRLSWPPG